MSSSPFFRAKNYTTEKNLSANEIWSRKVDLKTLSLYTKETHMEWMVTFSSAKKKIQFIQKRGLTMCTKLKLSPCYISNFI